jgi:hypothetical protein
MKIGILDDSVVQDVAKIIASHPAVSNVIIKKSGLSIDTPDIDVLVEYLEKVHGLHLIMNGNNYMIAAPINEANVEAVADKSLSELAAEKAGKVAQAGAQVAKKAVRAGVAGTTDKLKEQQMAKDRTRRGITGTLDPDEMQKKAEIDAKNLANKGQTRTAAGVTQKIIELAEIAKTKSPEQIKAMLSRNPELQKIISDPEFVKFSNELSARALGKNMPKTNMGEKPGQGDFVQIPKKLLGL